GVKVVCLRVGTLCEQNNFKLRHWLSKAWMDCLSLSLIGHCHVHTHDIDCLHGGRWGTKSGIEGFAELVTA
ncbi:hypothetical protein J6590_105395, partial [Homalodisca vitripennis]